MSTRDLVRSVAAGAGRAWLYCLKRAVWLALLSIMASFLQLSFSQSWDMAFSGDMEDENGTAIFPPCPANTSCEELPARCIWCNFNETANGTAVCEYGNMTNVSCSPRENIECNVRL